MTQPRTAKLFKNGSSQTVRLPVDYRFEGSDGYISRYAATGDVLLSSGPSTNTWDDFFQFVQAIDAPGGFMAERSMNALPKERGVLDDEVPA